MPRILLVDDSAVMRKIIQRNIKESGLIVDEFIEAGDGAQALDIVNKNMINKNDVDLILCDWNMPNMSGIEFVRNLRSLNFPKKIPVIMCTVEGSEIVKSEAKESGVDDFITKPFTVEQLRHCLGKYLLVK